MPSHRNLSLLLLALLAFVVCTNAKRVEHDIIDTIKNTHGNSQPVIGMLTLPIESSDKIHAKNMTRFHASYVKYLESAGAMVVPIHYNHTAERLEELMYKVNGIFFTGGALDIIYNDTCEYDAYGTAARFIYDKAIEMNENGIHFPLWGTCMGHQTILIMESRYCHILGWSDRYYKLDALNFHFLDQRHTKMFSDFSDELIMEVATQPVTMNFHHYGILYDDFMNNTNLRTNYTILSTNVGDDGFEYISSSEHKKYPFYTVQFHPETNLYKFYPDSYHYPSHSSTARELADLLSQKFIDEARKNANSFGDYDELKTVLVEAQGSDELDPVNFGEAFFFKYAMP